MIDLVSFNSRSPYKAIASETEGFYEFTFLSSSVKDEDGILNYATLIVKNTNPHILTIVNEFTQTIQLLSSKPE